MICYQKVIASKNYSLNCSFAMFLNQTNFNLTLIDTQINDWKSSMDFISVILDNTPFPINGSSGSQNLNISSTYFISIEPSNTYFYWMGVCKFFLA